MSGQLPLELQAARLRLARERPYLTSALWALNPVERKGMGTLAVDKWWRLYFDPAVVTKWNADELMAIIYHEIGHMLRDHPGRAEGGKYHNFVFNLAGDAEINDDLASEHGVKLPDGVVYPKTFGLPDGLLAEEYYDKIYENAKNTKVIQCKSCGGTGQVPKDPNGVGEGQSDKQDGKDQGKGGGKGSGQMKPCPDCGGTGITTEDGERVIPIPGGGNCGSVADGYKRPWEQDGPDGKNSPGITDTERELIRRQVAKDVEEHSKTRGDTPGWLQRWAKEKLTPRVDWKRQLQAAIRSAMQDIAGRTDYSYKRPSRRSSMLPDVVLPAMRDRIPSVIVQIDTSGSMSDKMLARALAETAGVLKACGLREGVTVLTVDAAVGFAKKVFRADQIEMIGGGGTDMGVGIAHIQKMRHPPDILIVLTDCYTPWPPAAPKFKLIIGRLSDGEVPSYGKVIDIKEN